MIDQPNARFDLYRQLIKPLQDRYGWVDFSDDGLLFNGLLSCVPGVSVDVRAAYDPTTGRWGRRPNTYPHYPETSDSTISRDMLLGVAWSAWVNKDLRMSESVITYALEHGLKMGDGSLSKVFISPGLLATFAWISYRLGGPSRPWLRWIPATHTKPILKDYQRHLQLLHLALRGRLEGRDLVRDVAQSYGIDPASTSNALVAVFENYSRLASCMLELFPTGRLPTTRDHAEPWLWQRDYGDDWKPDLNNPEKEHSGADFLFCYGLLKGMY